MSSLLSPALQSAMPAEPMPSVPRSRSAPSANHSPRVPICTDDHAAFRSHEPTWQAARCAGYEPRQDQIHELRTCPVCLLVVTRRVGFVTAVAALIEHLAASHRPHEIYVHSARRLMLWAHAHLPADLGLSSRPPTPEEVGAHLEQHLPPDWPERGRALRALRERAGLTRAQLSRRSGVAEATIRNYELARHRPTTATMQRIYAVPELLGSAPVPADAPITPQPGAAPCLPV